LNTLFTQSKTINHSQFSLLLLLLLLVREGH
jgi:hypothetical protein